MRLRKTMDAMVEMMSRLTLRLSELEDEQEGRVDHFEDEIETLKKRVSELEDELSQRDNAQDSTDKLMQDGIDAIFNYAPASISVTGGGHG
jgi:predicted nuclease with TOPRIM domain